MSRWRLASSVALGSLALLGCHDRSARSSEDGDVAETETETDTDTDTDTIGDGDGDGDETGDGDGDVYCDVTGFPMLEPIWIAALPIDWYPAGVVVTADAIFHGSYRVVSQVPADQVITRRSLDGEVQWSVAAPGYSGSLGWDGQHLYYLTSAGGDGSHGIRRLTGDGQPDPAWAFDAFDGTLTDLNVAGPWVLASGEVVSEVDEFDPNYHWWDVFTYQVDKQDAQLSSSDQFGEPYENERSSIVMPWSSGGYIAAMTRLSGGTLCLRGYEGATLEVDTGFAGATTHPSFMHELPDGLVVGANPFTSSSGSAWMMRVDGGGSVAWQRQLVPCGLEPSTFIQAAVGGPKHFWAIMGVEVQDDVHESLLVELDVTAELLASYAFEDSLDGLTYIRDIGSNGSEVVIVGGAFLPNQALFASWIARIR